MEGPIIAIVGCLHGDELIGQRIISRLNRLKIKKGVLLTIIANPEAIKAKKRFIDSDLNRSFPGRPRGNREERIAYRLTKILKQCDFIVDLHSTTTDTKSLVIATKLNKNILGVIGAFNPKRVALMSKKFSAKSMSYNFKACLSFEYGRDDAPEAFKRTLRDVLVLLSYFGLIDKKIDVGKRKTEFYKIIGTLVKKECFSLMGVKNFKLVKKGQVVAGRENEIIKAKKDFYPILFGERAYKDIFGFTAKKYYF